ncbi:hypothetical protein BDY17DRAFT_303306 [Neohortaea acidophila]|uniref:Uncharacterized protein n=1 Tax=Neohortaea acidophila TaxID=245834 RepID=A0A6A6PJP1_9PEZI|nr:uncharacterized protein BDY17DRAFT_303306 [Neohortaea acidophila]KAF2480145.1 hypothetical protein BDY17DRAFT_303306 [Neohortaea acidophila]
MSTVGMSTSSRSTSPDPITLPSSPLAIRSANAQTSPAPRRSPKPSTPRLKNAMHSSSPSKTFVMDTGKSGDASPWRIKVTVEAEPKEGSSPGKKITRTTKIPVKGLESSSPAKRNSARRVRAGYGGGEDADEEDGGKVRPQRKRRATPMRRRNIKTQEGTDIVEEDQGAGTAAISTSSRVSADTTRSKRLSKAREELHQALEEAVGPRLQTPADTQQDSDSDADMANEFDDEPGDLTVANEDFTMISVETLQSMKQNTSQLLDDSALSLRDRSVASISYMPSSPPMAQSTPYSVRYPNISSEASVHNHAMAPQSFTLDKDQSSERRIAPTATENNVEAGAEQAEVEAMPADDDIWAEEASRSLDEEVDVPHVVAVRSPSMLSKHSPRMSDLFSNDALRPARSKIPGTWRRESGNPFSYVDSPQTGPLRKTSTTSTEAEAVDGRSGGVLTPPSTDDEDSADKSTYEEGDTSLTQPDGEATQLHGVTQRPEVASPLSNSSSSATSPDSEGQETGLFWQRNLPNVYSRRSRPRFQRRQRVMDLSELLDLNGNPTPAKQQTVAPPTMHQLERSTMDSAPRRGPNPRTSRIASQTTIKENTVSSPLRKSLLKSSKMSGGNAMSATHSDRTEDESSRGRQPQVSHLSFNTSSLHQDSVQDSTCDSLQSKASDQRQLLSEMGVIPTPGGSSAVQSNAESSLSIASHPTEPSDYTFDEEHEEEYEEDASRDPGRSYEEHLNLDSPQKIRVNFNDSDGKSSLIAPKRNYPSLFGAEPPADVEPSARTSASVESGECPAERDTESQPGIFTRLSTTFWSAVVRPTGPASILPSEQQPPEPIYPHLLRHNIRSRYGVLSNQHPWTMAHMRTLHRLLNSCTSGKSDSLVPKSGPLPHQLEKLIGQTIVSITPDFSSAFTEQHAHVVDAFMQTLVPVHIADAIRDGEMDFLGDKEAKTHRGLLAGRHGDMVVYNSAAGVKEPKDGMSIERGWVVRAVGNCVRANIETARKEKLRIEKEQKMKRVQNGRGARVTSEEYDGSDESSRLVEDLALPKVRRV